MTLPWRDIDTVFLDAGNTLLGMDHSLMALQLSRLGHACATEAVARAEAAARPAVSARIARGASTESAAIFTYYMRKILEHILDLDDLELDQLAEHWTQALRHPGAGGRLWTRVLPDVVESVAALSAHGFKLAVVSNSNGSIEAALRAAGLRDALHAVIDSARVGFEKPDPRIFACALERTGSEPGRTLHVGDLYAVDVQGARAAGVHAVLLDPFGDWHEVDCPRVADLPSLTSRLLAARD